MSQMPVGEAGIKYDEIRMVIKGYASKMAEDRPSYSDLMWYISRLNQLAADCRKLWGD
jgi:hypothetical protein